MVLAGVLLVPALAPLWAAVTKLVSPVPLLGIQFPLTVTDVGVMVVLVVRVGAPRLSAHADSLTRAAFLSARNDVTALARQSSWRARHKASWWRALSGLTFKSGLGSC